MFSLNPFFSHSYFPALSACNLYDSQIDRNLGHLYSVIRYEPAEDHVEPNYSLVEKDEQAHLEVELPGVTKENINVDITGNKLVITAKRFRAVDNVDEKPSENARDETNDDSEDGKDADMNDAKKEEPSKPSVVYQLKIRVGHRYDTENIQASMDGDGILKMVLPLKKKEGARKIEIN